MGGGVPRGYSKEGSSARTMDILGRLEVPITQPISLVGKTGVPPSARISAQHWEPGSNVIEVTFLGGFMGTTMTPRLNVTTPSQQDSGASI